jgi:hypothetical protein
VYCYVNWSLGSFYNFSSSNARFLAKIDFYYLL